VDDGRLRVGVLLHVLPLAAGQLALLLGVELAVGGVLAQPIAEEEHPVDLLTPGSEDVDVDLRVGSLEEAMLVPVGLANP